jgi:hypothetical protein
MYYSSNRLKVNTKTKIRDKNGTRMTGKTNHMMTVKTPKNSSRQEK